MAAGNPEQLGRVLDDLAPPHPDALRVAFASVSEREIELIAPVRGGKASEHFSRRSAGTPFARSRQ